MAKILANPNLKWFTCDLVNVKRFNYISLFNSLFVRPCFPLWLDSDYWTSVFNAWGWIFTVKSVFSPLLQWVCTQWVVSIVWTHRVFILTMKHARILFCLLTVFMCYPAITGEDVPTALCLRLRHLRDVKKSWSHTFKSVLTFCVWCWSGDSGSSDPFKGSVLRRREDFCLCFQVKALNSAYVFYLPHTGGFRRSDRYCGTPHKLQNCEIRPSWSGHAALELQQFHNGSSDSSQIGCDRVRRPPLRVWETERETLDTLRKRRPANTEKPPVEMWNMNQYPGLDQVSSVFHVKECRTRKSTFKAQHPVTLTSSSSSSCTLVSCFTTKPMSPPFNVPLASEKYVNISFDRLFI